MGNKAYRGFEAIITARSFRQVTGVAARGAAGTVPGALQSCMDTAAAGAGEKGKGS